MFRHMDTYLEVLVEGGAICLLPDSMRFCRDLLAPHVLTWERQHCLVPDDAIAAMAQLGLFGLTVSEQYGGQGGKQMELVLMGLALGYYSQSLAITPGAAASLGIKPWSCAAVRHRKRRTCQSWRRGNAWLPLASLNPVGSSTLPIQKPPPRLWLAAGDCAVRSAGPPMPNGPAISSCMP